MVDPMFSLGQRIAVESTRVGAAGFDVGGSAVDDTNELVATDGATVCGNCGRNLVPGQAIRRRASGDLRHEECGSDALSS